MIAFDQLFLLGVLSATIHWLIARAEISRPLWSRAPAFLDKLLRCPSCSGFWISGGLVFAGIRPLSPFVPIPLWLHALVGGLLGIVLTPVVQALHLWALERTTVAEEPIDVTASVNDDNDDQITPPDLPSTRTRSGS